MHVLAQMWMAQCFANDFSSTNKFLFHQFVAETISTRYAAASKISYVPRSQFQFEERWVPLLCYNLFYFSFSIFGGEEGVDWFWHSQTRFIYLFILILRKNINNNSDHPKLNAYQTFFFFWEKKMHIKPSFSILDFFACFSSIKARSVA